MPSCPFTSNIDEDVLAGLESAMLVCILAGASQTLQLLLYIVKRCNGPTPLVLSHWPSHRVMMQTLLNAASQVVDVVVGCPKCSVEAVLPMSNAGNRNLRCRWLALIQSVDVARAGGRHVTNFEFDARDVEGERTNATTRPTSGTTRSGGCGRRRGRHLASCATCRWLRNKRKRRRTRASKPASDTRRA